MQFNPEGPASHCSNAALASMRSTSTDWSSGRTGTRRDSLVCGSAPASLGAWTSCQSRPTGFYVANADLEHIVVDLATRKVRDAFTLSEGNRRVRIMAYAPDPQRRVMALIATTTKLVDRLTQRSDDVILSPCSTSPP